MTEVMARPTSRRRRSCIQRVRRVLENRRGGFESSIDAHRDHAECGEEECEPDFAVNTMPITALRLTSAATRRRRYPRRSGDAPRES